MSNNIIVSRSTSKLTSRSIGISIRRRKHLRRTRRGSISKRTRISRSRSRRGSIS